MNDELKVNIKNLNRGLIFAIITLSFLSRVWFLNGDMINVDEGIYGVYAKVWMSGGGAHSVGAIGCTKPPGMSIIYMMIFKILGKNFIFIHAAAMFFITIAALWVYFTARSKAGLIPGFAAALFFLGIVNSSFAADDLMAFNSEITAIFFTIPATFIIIKRLTGKIGAGYLILAGILSSIAVIIRVNSALNLIFLFLSILIFRAKGIRQVLFEYALTAAGFLLGFLPLLIYYWHHGWLDELYLYAYIFPKMYSQSVGIKIFMLRAFGFFAGFFRTNLLTTLGAVFFAVFYIKRIFAQKKIELNAELLFLLWFIVEAASVSLGRRFAGHYFITLATPFAILSALGFMMIFKGIKSSLPENLTLPHFFYISAVIYSLAFIVFSPAAISEMRDFSKKSLDVNLDKSSQEYYERAVEKWLRENAQKGDKLFVWGFSPQTYFFSGLLPGARDFLCEISVSHIPGAVSMDETFRKTHNPFDRFDEITCEELIKNRTRWFVDLGFSIYGKGFCYWNNIEDYPSFNNLLHEHYTLRDTIGIVKIYEMKQ